MLHNGNICKILDRGRDNGDDDIGRRDHAKCCSDSSWDSTLFVTDKGRRVGRNNARDIQKTKKVTRYCDRVTDGYPCKQRGARFKRNLVEEQDGALKICNQLRDRMYARLLRWQDAAPSERGGLIPMNYDQYSAWSENARLARIEYLEGKLMAEEFLRRVDVTQELTSYETDKVELVEETDW